MLGQAHYIAVPSMAGDTSAGKRYWEEYVINHAPKSHAAARFRSPPRPDSAIMFGAT